MSAADKPQSDPCRTAGLVILVAVLVVALAGCGDDPTLPADPDPEPEGMTQEELVENTRDVAKQICETFGPRKVAREYDAPPNNLDAIARAYSMDSRPGPHRDASYAGCLEGFATR